MSHNIAALVKHQKLKAMSSAVFGLIERGPAYFSVGRHVSRTFFYSCSNIGASNG